MDANTLSYEITSLEPYSEYRIRILAFTVADGPKSASKSVYTDKNVLPRKCFRTHLSNLSCSIAYDKEAKVINILIL